MSRRHISTGSAFEQKIGYSRAVVDGEYVFISGTTGYDYATMSLPDDVVAQAEQCMRNIERVLEEAGSGWANVVRVRYILPRREDFEPCWPVLNRYLGEAAPAATMLVADLFEAEMKIEVEVTARLSAGAQRDPQRGPPRTF